MMAHFVVRQTQWMQHDSFIDVLLKCPSVTILLWDDLVALAIGEANTGCPRHLGSLTFSLDVVIDSTSGTAGFVPNNNGRGTY
jgi:hypothetical protein